MLSLFKLSLQTTADVVHENDSLNQQLKALTKQLQNSQGAEQNANEGKLVFLATIKTSR